MYTLRLSMHEYLFRPGEILTCSACSRADSAASAKRACSRASRSALRRSASAARSASRAFSTASASTRRASSNWMRKEGHQLICFTEFIKCTMRNSDIISVTLLCMYRLINHTIANSQSSTFDISYFDALLNCGGHGSRDNVLQRSARAAPSASDRAASA